MLNTSPVEKHIHQIGSWMGADVKTEHHTEDPIQMIHTGEGVLGIEQGGVSDPEYD